MKYFNIDNIDNSVNPGDDFYQYANGNWLKNNPIPPEYARWGSFEILFEENYLQLKAIMENPNKYQGTEYQTIAEKISRFYSVGMDEEKIEKQGYLPIIPELERIDKISDISDLAEEIAHIHCFTASPLFGFMPTPDSKNSSMTISGLIQGGLGLPDRDYYLKDENNYPEVREKYKQLISRIFVLISEPEEKAKKSSEIVFNIERELAKFSFSREELRDPIKNYNKMTVQELINLSPMFDWSKYFSGIGLSDPGYIDVGQVGFFKGMNELMNEFNLEKWKVYLKWHLIISLASYLKSDFVNEKFDFYGRYLNGQEKIKERWKRVIDVAESCIGFDVGKVFVSEYFSATAKKRAENLVKNIIDTVKERIIKLDWMEEITKKEALQKLNNMTCKIGYPEEWIDYSNLQIRDDSYVENVIRAMHFEHKRNINKINKPTDRKEWHMFPQTINAYFNPLNNEIVFPAGILQPPFFFAEADEAVNYGGIGSVIGHEITHAFDDQGRQYDSKGNLRDWWTKADEIKFKESTKKLVVQYNNYEPVKGQKINGEFTLGENIADLGGTSISFEAMEKAIKGKVVNKIDGFSQQQRFFLSYAETWKSNIREEKARLLLTIDPHSAAKYRVNGVLRNLPEFFQAFDVKENNNLYQKESEIVKIW